MLKAAALVLVAAWPTHPSTSVTFLANGDKITVRHADGFVRFCKRKALPLQGTKHFAYTWDCGDWFDPRKHSKTPIN